MRFLLDEMLPPATVDELAALGHDAIGAVAAGLGETEDDVVYAAAVEQDRVVVTENFGDYSAVLAVRLAAEQPCVPVVFVRKSALPKRGALAAHLARLLDTWAEANPDPYLGAHWP